MMADPMKFMTGDPAVAKAAMTSPPTPPGDDLVERLRKRSKLEREIADNSALVFELLQPEFAKFEAREAFNVYAVRMAVDHKNSAAKDKAFADDLDTLLDRISSLEAEKRGLVEALELIEFYSDSEYARETARDAIATLTKAGSVVPETKA
jgi:hypothetical protein